jgi:outer membrane protein OmpA-like peptidoglycan-associated protein
MKSLFFKDAHDNSVMVTSGVADLMTSLAVIFILLLVASLAGIEDNDVDPVRNRTIPTNGTAKIELPHPSPDADRPAVHTVTVPDTAITFEFGKSTLLPPAEAFLSEAMPSYASIACGTEGREVEAFVIEGYTDDLGDDIRNLRLSQERSFAVLAKSLEVIRDKLPWAYECFLHKATATGRGKQNLLRDSAGHTVREKSRRVIFKIYLRPT